MLRNTYLNSLNKVEHTAEQKDSAASKSKKKKQSVQWTDHGKDVKSKLEVLNEEMDLVNKDRIHKVTVHYDVECKDIKPVLKNSRSKDKHKFKNSKRVRYALNIYRTQLQENITRRTKWNMTN